MKRGKDTIDGSENKKKRKVEEEMSEEEFMLSLLYTFLDELLYGFCADEFCVRDCHISTFDTQRFRIRATSRGETFDLAKHTQGTEIKAITYSNMQVHDVGSHSTEGRDAHVYVIVDI